jgi:hypothetical protein
MSISEKYINRKLSGDTSITELLYELGIDPNVSCRVERLKLFQHNPSSFLSKSDNGNPTFQVRGEFGELSEYLIKKGLSVAKAKFTQTGEPRYQQIIDRLERELTMIQNKIHPVPKLYKFDPTLMNINGYDK